eukprot:jgi/Botrbrau1/19508/Bobra.0035s0009.2
MALSTFSGYSKPWKHPRELLAVLIHLALWSEVGVLTRLWLDLLVVNGCDGGWGVCLTSTGVRKNGYGSYFGDLFANSLGSFVMGALAASATLQLKTSKALAILRRTHPWQDAPELHIGLRTGFCGSLTTFASWDYQLMTMLIGGRGMKGGQWPEFLWGWVVGLYIPFVSYLTGEHLALWVDRWYCEEDEDEIGMRIEGGAVEVRGSVQPQRVWNRLSGDEEAEALIAVGTALAERGEAELTLKGIAARVAARPAEYEEHLRRRSSLSPTSSRFMDPSLVGHLMGELRRSSLSSTNSANSTTTEHAASSSTQGLRAAPLAASDPPTPDNRNALPGSNGQSRAGGGTSVARTSCPVQPGVPLDGGTEAVQPSGSVRSLAVQAFVNARNAGGSGTDEVRPSEGPARRGTAPNGQTSTGGSLGSDGVGELNRKGTAPVASPFMEHDGGSSGPARATSTEVKPLDTFHSAVQGDPLGAVAVPPAPEGSPLGPYRTRGTVQASKSVPRRPGSELGASEGPRVPGPSQNAQGGAAAAGGAHRRDPREGEGRLVDQHGMDRRAGGGGVGPNNIGGVVSEAGPSAQKMSFQVEAADDNGRDETASGATSSLSGDPVPGGAPMRDHGPPSGEQWHFVRASAPPGLVHAAHGDRPHRDWLKVPRWERHRRLREWTSGPRPPWLDHLQTFRWEMGPHDFEIVTSLRELAEKVAAEDAAADPGGPHHAPAPDAAAAGGDEGKGSLSGGLSRRLLEASHGFWVVDAERYLLHRKTNVFSLLMLIGLTAAMMYLAIADITTRATARWWWVAVLFGPLGCTGRWLLAPLNYRLPLPWDWYPVGTFAANVLACTVNYCLGAALVKQGGGGMPLFVPAVQKGFCGALSTVSTFMAEIRGQSRFIPQFFRPYIYAAVTIAVSVVLGIVIYGPAVWTGIDK